MAGPDNPFVLLYDYSGGAIAYTTSRAAAALPAPLAGVVALGSDYAATPKGQVPRVDAAGNVYTASTSTATTGTALSSATGIAADIMAGMQGLTPTPLQIDGQNNVLAAPAVSPTFSVLAQGVAVNTGKSLLALVNKSTSSIVRIVAAYAQNSLANQGILTTYYVYAEQLNFITGASGGTALTPLAFDTADSLASGITCSTGASVTGEVSPPIRRWITSGYPLAAGATAAEDTTADQQGRDPWTQRYDSSSKLPTIRPGMGVHLKSASTSTNSVQDVTFVFTVSAA